MAATEQSVRAANAALSRRRRERAAVDVARMLEGWDPDYDSWRHGGWYVGGAPYPDGAIGCVSRNYADRQWRIVCADGALGRTVFPNRDAAAQAERLLTLALSLGRPEVA